MFSSENWDFPSGADTDQAKNDDKQFLKEGFHAAEGKGEHALSRGGGDLIVFLARSISAPAISPGEKQCWKRKIHAGNG
jgi:hypothetical protein